MARQQRHLAGDHAEAGPAARLRRGRRLAGGRGDSRRNLGPRAAQIEVDRRSGHVVEGEQRPLGAGGRRRLERQRDVDQRPGRQTALAVEGGAGMGEAIGHHKAPMGWRIFYPDDNCRCNFTRI